MQEDETGSKLPVDWKMPSASQAPAGWDPVALVAEKNRLRRRRQLYRFFCLGPIALSAGLTIPSLSAYFLESVVQHFSSFAVLVYFPILVALLYWRNLPCRCVSIGANFGFAVVTLLSLVRTLASPPMLRDIIQSGHWVLMIFLLVLTASAAVAVYFAPRLIKLELTLEKAPARPLGFYPPQPVHRRSPPAHVSSKWLRAWQGFVILPMAIHFAVTPYHAIMDWSGAGTASIVEAVCGLCVAAWFMTVMFARPPLRLLAYGASCYFAVTNSVGYVQNLIFMPRTDANRFAFEVLPDSGGWLETAWYTLWLVTLIFTVINATRLMRADLHEVVGSSGPRPNSEEELAEGPGWDRAKPKAE